jgi:hypothetical protein
MWIARITLFALLTLVAAPAVADEVIFLNGDRLTGKIISATGGKLILKTDAAGEITIDLSKVKTFSTDEPIMVKLGDKAPLPTNVGPGAEGQVQAETPPGAGAQAVPITDISAIVPPPAWHGSLALNGLLTTGNSEAEQLGFTAALGKRWESDRLTFGATYLRPAEGPGHRRKGHHRRLRADLREV